MLMGSHFKLKSHYFFSFVTCLNLLFKAIIIRKLSPRIWVYTGAQKHGFSTCAAVVLIEGDGNYLLPA